MDFKYGDNSIIEIKFQNDLEFKDELEQIKKDLGYLDFMMVRNKIQNEIVEVTMHGNEESVLFKPFQELDNLEKVTFDDSTKEICEYVCYCCYNLKEVNLPKNLKDLGKSAFQYCEALESISIPDGVTEIQDETFNRCKSLKKLKLPTSLQAIKACAFGNCKSLTEIEIPEGTISIGVGAFENNDLLEKVSLPSTITQIANNAFEHCDKLNEVLYKNVNISEILKFDIKDANRFKIAKEIVDNNIDFNKFDDDEKDFVINELKTKSLNQMIETLVLNDTTTKIDLNVLLDKINKMTNEQYKNDIDKNKQEIR
jgi:hypothetical protein